MLNLVLGRSGSGKTFYVRKALIDKANDLTEKLILIVPEQNSFESEKGILEMGGSFLANKVQIFSFTSLVDFIFKKLGGFSGKRIDDGGRNILMSLAIEEVKDQLSIYKGQAAKTEFIDLMLNGMKELKSCGTTTGEISEIIKTLDIKKDLQASKSNKMDDDTLNSDANLANKLKDISLVMNAYEALISQAYLDPIDDLTRAHNMLLEHPKLFEEYTIVLDAFSGFTKQELLILECIIKQSKECYITLCTDTTNFHSDEFDLFEPVNKTARQIISIAKSNNIKISAPIQLNATKRFNNSSLKTLEEKIFKLKTSFVKDDNLESRDKNHVIIYNADDIYDEIDFVARTIKKEIFEKGFEYRNFIIITRSMTSYDTIIEAIFEKYEIPYFMDRRENISLKPIMSFILSAFDIIHSNFESEHIFRYLKTGLTSLSIEEISIVENYCLLWNINKNDWLEDFDYHIDGLINKNDDIKDKLDRLNKIRSKIILPLVEFKNKITDTTGLQISKAVYSLLEEAKTREKILDFSKSFNKTGNIDLADEQPRLWDLLIDTLDQMAMILKDKFIKSTRYKELLKLVINSNDLGYVPQGIDEVKIGSADRIRPDHPKVVFVIGATDGDFPANPLNSGVFSDNQRKKLISMGFSLYDPIEKRALDERFLAYTSLTSPSDYLYVSWSKQGITGECKYPSVIVSEVIKALPNCLNINRASQNTNDLLWAIKPSFEFLAKNSQETSKDSLTLKKYFSSKREYDKKLNLIKQARKTCSQFFENKNNVKLVFGDNMKLSASQIEKFYLCKFQYFCQYGLGVKKRKTDVLDAMDYGSLVHFILEKILSNYGLEELKLLNKKDLQFKIEDLLKEFIKDKSANLGDKSARFEYLFNRLSKTACELILHIIKELLQSDFKPSDFELEIGKNGLVEPLEIKLPNGKKVLVEGKVDRVDVMKKDGISYVRIIDYKTGSKQFKLSDIIYGVNMQMFLYLAAIIKNGQKKYGEKIVPAGILYMPANISSVSANRGTSTNKLENEKIKKLKMNGLVLNDPDVIYGMEKEAKGVFIPVALKDGKPAKLDSVVNIAEMGQILKKIESLVVSMEKTLGSGNIKSEPLNREVSACEYCDYKCVCGHEQDDISISVEKLDRDNAMKKLYE